MFSGIGGALILLGALMASPTLDDQLSSGGLAYVVTSRLGDVWGRVFLADVVLAAFVCTLAIQTATTRMIYSMSRDEVLPYSKKLRTVSKRGATVYASVLVGIGAAALLLINLGHAGVFTALTSTCIVLLYLAYLCVTGPMLYRRLKGWPAELGPQNDETGNPVFSLGRWGLPVNILAVVWGLAMAVNLAWPRQEVFDPDGTNVLLQYFALIIVALTLVGGSSLSTSRRRLTGPPLVTCSDPQTSPADRSAAQPGADPAVRLFDQMASRVAVTQVEASLDCGAWDE